jgi:hypothetical protein
MPNDSRLSLVKWHCTWLSRKQENQVTTPVKACRLSPIKYTLSCQQSLDELMASVASTRAGTKVQDIHAPKLRQSSKDASKVKNTEHGSKIRRLESIVKVVI